ncbi:hypothetical protein ACLOAV_004525 [Pseudogymnoascus australis]
MAQRPDQSPRNPNSWDHNLFIPSFYSGSTLNQGGTLNSPGVAALSSNSNGHGHFTSNLFQGQEVHNNSSGPHQDHTIHAPFTANHPVNGTTSTVEEQRQELVNILTQKIQENIMKENMPAVREDIKKEITEETFSEIRHLKVSMARLESAQAEASRAQAEASKVQAEASR